MKFAVWLFLSYVCLVNAFPESNEHFIGITSRGEVMGTKDIKAEMPISNQWEYTRYEFTFPEVIKI